MSRYLPAPELVDSLLEEGVPDDWTVAAELGVDSADHLPHVTHDTSIDPESNGAGLNYVTLTVNLYDTPETLLANCELLHDVIHGWARGGGAINGIGVVHTVEDTSPITPGRTSAMLGKNFRQATGIYVLGVTNHL